LRHLTALTLGVAVAGAILALLDRHAPWPLYAAVALSSLALLLLHLRRRTLAALELRAAADLALLTPLLLVPFL
jgi:hypothetical protein